MVFFVVDGIAPLDELILSRVMLLCRPIGAEVGLEAGERAIVYVSSLASPAIIYRSIFPLRFRLWNILSGTCTY